jgi:N4-gp56 family major capsid protein
VSTTYTGTTGTSAVANLVQTGYDRLVEHGLRAQPLFRNFADKRPQDVTGPTATVTLQFWTDLAPVTAALTENVDNDAVALSNTTTVNVTLQEWGQSGLSTRKMELTSLSDIDLELVEQITWNMVDSLDVQAQLAAVGLGNNIVYPVSGAAPTALAANAGATYSGGSGCTAIAATNIMNSNTARYTVTKLRAAKVMPWKANLYAHIISPEMSADLRQETGAAAWRDPHVYSGVEGSQNMIWAGEIGAYEGAFFIESPRVFSNQLGTGAGGSQTRVFNSYVFGKQFLAEATGEEPHIVFGPITDKMRRFRPVSWYGFLGWSVFRSASLAQICAASTFRPNT